MLFSIFCILVSDEIFLLEEETRLTTNDTGLIRSFNWPLSYPSGFQSKIRLRAPTAHLISVTVEYLALDNSGSSVTPCMDVLQVIDLLFLFPCNLMRIDFFVAF